jgi:hypothetical protein
VDRHASMGVIIMVRMRRTRVRVCVCVCVCVCGRRLRHLGECLAKRPIPRERNAHFCSHYCPFRTLCSTHWVVIPLSPPSMPLASPKTCIAYQSGTMDMDILCPDARLLTHGGTNIFVIRAHWLNPSEMRNVSPLVHIESWHAQLDSPTDDT